MGWTFKVDYSEALPDALHMTRREFELEARLAMAIKLFETGKLSSGQASALADLSRTHFLYELGRFNVSSIQLEDSGLEADLSAARRAHDRARHQPGD